MADKTENLVLEHLRHIRATTDKLWDKVGSLEQQMIAVRKHLNGFDADFIRADEHFAGIEARLDRIEKRVGLIDA